MTKEQWLLFLDDERQPTEAHIDQGIEIARSYSQAVRLIEQYSCCPSFVSFDHDLGDNVPTGKDFANYLIEKDLDNQGNFIPEDFTFYVHSQNNVGKENIEGILNNYLEFKKNNNNENKNSIKF